MPKPLILGGYTPDWGTVTGGLVSGVFRKVEVSDDILSKAIDVSIGGTFVATINIERYIGSDWRIIEQLTAPAERYIENRKAYPIRLNCVAYTSGTVDYALEA
jgi:hypothetical protein